MSGLRKMSGNEFQTDGPATEKARRRRRSNILSWYRGTTRSRRLADHRCCRDDGDVTSETERLCSEWRVLRCLTMNTAEHHDDKLEHDSFRNVEARATSENTAKTNSKN